MQQLADATVAPVAAGALGHEVAVRMLLEGTIVKPLRPLDTSWTI